MSVVRYAFDKLYVDSIEKTWRDQQKSEPLLYTVEQIANEKGDINSSYVKANMELCLRIINLFAEVYEKGTKSELELLADKITNFFRKNWLFISNPGGFTENYLVTYGEGKGEIKVSFFLLHLFDSTVTQQTDLNLAIATEKGAAAFKAFLAGNLPADVEAETVVELLDMNEKRSNWELYRACFQKICDDRKYDATYVEANAVHFLKIVNLFTTLYSHWESDGQNYLADQVARCFKANSLFANHSGELKEDYLIRYDEGKREIRVSSLALRSFDPKLAKKTDLSLPFKSQDAAFAFKDYLATGEFRGYNEAETILELLEMSITLGSEPLKTNCLVRLEKITRKLKTFEELEAHLIKLEKTTFKEEGLTKKISELVLLTLNQILVYHKGCGIFFGGLEESPVIPLSAWYMLDGEGVVQKAFQKNCQRIGLKEEKDIEILMQLLQRKELMPEFSPFSLIDTIVLLPESKPRVTGVSNFMNIHAYSFPGPHTTFLPETIRLLFPQLKTVTVFLKHLHSSARSPFSFDTAKGIVTDEMTQSYVEYVSQIRFLESIPVKVEGIKELHYTKLSPGAVEFLPFLPKGSELQTLVLGPWVYEKEGLPVLRALRDINLSHEQTASTVFLGQIQFSFSLLKSFLDHLQTLPDPGQEEYDKKLDDFMSQLKRILGTNFYLTA